AYHALWGEVWDKAVTYCQQAGARAFDRAAFREAATALEHTLQALGHLPEGSDIRVPRIEPLTGMLSFDLPHLPEHGDPGGLGIDLRLALCRLLIVLAEYGRCLTLLGEAEALARACDDQARLGRVLAYMATIRRTTGDLDGAVATSRQALDLV